jgi:hypothetical protein
MLFGRSQQGACMHTCTRCRVSVALV